MKHFFIGFFICVALFSAQAQELQIKDIEMLNLGDGRLFARERKDDKAINGRVRIITGYTTEYIDAGFAEGYAEGKWDYYRNNKLSQSETYSKGYVEGESIKYYADGTTVQSKVNLKNGKADGIITRYSQDGKIEYEKGMKDGIDDGPERFYDESGKVVSEIIYKNGKAEGKSFTFYNRGNSDAYLQTGYYKNGLQDGEYSEIYDNGTVKVKGKYLNGKKEGVWETNKEDGSKRPTEEFKEGEVIRRITYFTDGKIEMERNFDLNGKQHGVEKKYDWEDGSLKSELNYVHGKQIGKQVRYVSSNSGSFIETSYYNEAGQKEGEYTEIYTDNKNIKTKGQYLKGQKHGKWVYGYPRSLYKEETYDNGKLIDSKKLE
jgi:antitoxin component YwqK of YwqJK toxin-antitoxin module